MSVIPGRSCVVNRERDVKTGMCKWSNFLGKGGQSCVPDLMGKARISFSVGGFGFLKGSYSQSVRCCQFSVFGIPRTLCVGAVLLLCYCHFKEQRNKASSTSRESCAAVGGGIPGYRAGGTQLKSKHVLTDSLLTLLLETSFTSGSGHAPGLVAECWFFPTSLSWDD